MRAWIWAALAAAGFLWMVGSYQRWMRIDSAAPWSSGFLCIGDAEPAERFDTGAILSTRLRFLPLNTLDEAMLQGIGRSLPKGEPFLRARFRRKLIELPAAEMGMLVGWLREGRMPEPGRDEVLGGSDWNLGESPTVSGRSLRVVGVLSPSVALFTDALLIVADRSAEPLFAAGDPDVSRVRIVRLSGEEFRNRKLHERLAKAFPDRAFVTLPAQVHSPRTGHHAYLAGQALLLFGGTGVLAALYRWLSSRSQGTPLAEPLAEIVGRPRLFWGMHLAYFGLYLVGAVLIHENRAVQAALMTAVQEALSGGGPLGIAGRAYQSGSILRAAWVTFVVNFLLGALLVITLPSLVLPGCGVLVAAFRAILWGLLLGPADTALALAMLPHSGTLLLEGEGYILAAFFALLIPIRLFGSGQAAKAEAVSDEWPPAEGYQEVPRSSWLGRFGGGLVLNLKGLLLVALVLAVAAYYEAVEVIWMAGL